MGLLERLRQESSTARDLEQKEKQLADTRQKDYDAKVIPKLEIIWRYLKELEQHLNFLKPDIKTDYNIPGFGQFKQLKQSQYKMEKGRKKVLQRIPFRFSCTSEASLELIIEGNRKLAATIEELDRIGLKYQCAKQRDVNNEVYGGVVELQSYVPVSLTFEGILDIGCIELTLKNYSDLSTSRTLINPESIDQEFLDQLGHFIMRKENSFMKKELSDEQKEHFRKLVLADQQQREEELRDSEDID